MLHYSFRSNYSIFRCKLCTPEDGVIRNVSCKTVYHVLEMYSEVFIPFLLYLKYRCDTSLKQQELPRMDNVRSGDPVTSRLYRTQQSPTVVDSLKQRYLLYMSTSGLQILVGVILRSLTPPYSDSFHLRL